MTISLSIIYLLWFETAQSYFIVTKATTDRVKILRQCGEQLFILALGWYCLRRIQRRETRAGTLKQV